MKRKLPSAPPFLLACGESGDGGTRPKLGPALRFDMARGLPGASNLRLPDRIGVIVELGLDIDCAVMRGSRQLASRRATFLKDRRSVPLGPTIDAPNKIHASQPNRHSVQNTHDSSQGMVEGRRWHPESRKRRQNTNPTLSDAGRQRRRGISHFHIQLMMPRAFQKHGGAEGEVTFGSFAVPGHMQPLNSDV